MRDRRGTPFGAAVIACALFVITSPCFGGAVCERENDASTTTIAASHDARPSEWLARILGEDYIAVRHASAAAEGAALPDVSYTSDISESPAGPRAAVIPLPAPFWSGMAGLAALTIASGINKIRKLL